MRLEEALPHLRAGKKIRCEEWVHDVYCYLDDDIIMCFAEGKYERLSLIGRNAFTSNDLLSDNYIILGDNDVI